MDGYTDRQIVIQAGRQTNGWMNRQTESYTDKKDRRLKYFLKNK